MPLARPPAAAKVSPRRATLRAGAGLWRVHSRCRPGTEFRQVAPDPHFGGNRFDSTPDDPFPYLYAATDGPTALLETLVRDVPFDNTGKRMIHRTAVRGRRLTLMTPTVDLALISLLTTADLASSCQDEWLTQTRPAEYPQTRRWSQWLRARTPWAQGMIWLSCRNLGCQSLVLFGDRLPAGVLTVVPGAAVDLDDGAGAAWLNRQLEPYRVSVRLPPRSGEPASAIRQEPRTSDSVPTSQSAQCSSRRETLSFEAETNHSNAIAVFEAETADGMPHN
jgi:hypothetical protein